MMVYNELLTINKLSKKKYDELVIKYGVMLVDKIIDMMIEQDDKNILKFEYYLSKKSDSLCVEEVDSYSAYISDIEFMPRLSYEENQSLALEICDIISRMNVLFSSVSVPALPISLKKQFLITDKFEYWLDNIDDLDTINGLKMLYKEFIDKRNKLVEGNLRLVIYIAKRHKKNMSDISLNELVQFGNGGLMRAVEKYNPQFDTAFSTYAYYWITQSIKRGIKSISCIFANKSYDLIQLNNVKLSAIDVLSFELGRYPTRLEIANYMGVPVSKVLQIEETMQLPLSMNSDAIAHSDDGAEFFLIDSLEDASKNTEKYVVSKTMRAQLMSILMDDNLFSEKDRMVILYLNGFIDGDTHTFEDTGKYIGVTKQRVKQIEDRVLRRLRAICKNQGIDEGG